jgi:hypothetical protein
MSKVVKRATISFDPDLHRALRIKAAVSRSLAQDAVDLAAFQDRVHEPTVAFEDVLRDLKSLRVYPDATWCA